MTPNSMGPDLSSWTFWWGFNREKYLQLKAKIAKSSDVFTGEAEGLLGGGNGGRDSMRPTAEQIAKDVLPYLKESLEKETNRDIVTGCLIALCQDWPEPQMSMDLFKKFLSSNDQEIAETAALSYGILAAPEGSSRCAIFSRTRSPDESSLGSPRFLGEPARSRPTASDSPEHAPTIRTFATKSRLGYRIS